MSCIAFKCRILKKSRKRIYFETSNLKNIFKSVDADVDKGLIAKLSNIALFNLRDAAPRNRRAIRLRFGVERGQHTGKRGDQRPLLEINSNNAYYTYICSSISVTAGVTY